MLMSHARNGDEFHTPRHRGSPANVDVLAFVILVNPKFIRNSWNLACYHGAPSTCHGKFFVPFGAGLEICFSQTRGSHNNLMVSVGNVSPFWMKWYPLPLLDFNFFPSVSIEQQGCCVNFWDFWGFAWTFLYINWVFYAFMCIIQIWTTWTCSNAYKLVKNSNLCPWLHA